MNPVFWLLFFTVTTLCFARDEAKPKPVLNGKAIADGYFPYYDFADERIRQIDFSLWPKAEIQFDESKSLNAEGFIQRFQRQIDNELGSGEQTRLGLYEGYFFYKNIGFDLKFGKQVIAWGKSDVVNPTDVHTGRDRTWFSHNDDLKKIGSFSLLTNFTPKQGVSPYTFTAIWTPIPAFSKPLFPKGSTPAGVKLTDAREPDSDLWNSEFSFKTAYNASQWDISMMIFRGFDHDPFLHFEGFSGTILSPTAVVSQRYKKITVLGSDFSIAFSDYVLRIEAAHTWTENNEAKNPLISPPHFDLVVGAERPFFTDYRLQMQWVARYHTAYEQPSKTSDLIGAPNSTVYLLNNALAESNAFLHGYQRRERHAFTMRFSYTDPSQDWDAEVFTMAYFSDWDSLIRPKGSYLIAENFRGTLGFEHYDGPEGTPLGSMRKYDSLFLELKYSF